MSRTKISSPRIEASVLRGICSGNQKMAATLLSSLDLSHFSSEVAKEVFSYLKEKSATDGKIPFYKVVAEDATLSKNAREYLKDSAATLKSRTDVNTAIKSLDKYKQLRALNLLQLSVAEGLTAKKVDVDDLLKVAIQHLADANSKRASADNFLYLGKDSNSKELLNELLDGDKTENVIPTGLKTFDRDSGGLLRGALFTIGGNSGAGKSQMASSLAVNFASMGYKVVLVPLEMSKSEMLARIVANVAEIDSLKINLGRLSDKEKRMIRKKFAKWERAVAKKGGQYTIYKPGEDVTISDVYNIVDTMACDVCIVDYVSLLKETPGEDQWKQLGSTARYAKINAETTNRVNILLCQINDDGTIRYSRAINEHSSNSWIFVANEDTKAQGIMKVQQTKSRNQNQYPFTLGINYAHSKVYDLEGYEDQLPITNHQEMPNLAAQPDV